MAHYLDQVTVDSLGALGHRQQWCVVFLIELHLPLAEVHGDFVVDVVIVELTEAGGVGFDLCLVSRDPRLMLP